jgi:hypothetical protein
METDNDRGITYVAAYLNPGTGGALLTINRATGATTLVGAFQGNSEICGFAIPYTPTATLAASSIVTNASCPTASDGGVDVTPSGGLPPYQYLWSNAATTQNITGVPVGDYTVIVTDAAGCTTFAGGSVGYDDPVCDYAYPEGDVTTIMCYDAHIMITVGGPGKTFHVIAPTGSVELISYGSIKMLEGVHVDQGAYLWAHISNTFCDGIPPPLPSVATTVNEVTGLTTARFTLYPNPTSGNFVLVQKGDRDFGTVKVEVYNMSGMRVMTEQMIGEKQHEFGFSELPFGMYFVKVVADEYVETIKLIKTR